MRDERGYLIREPITISAEKYSIDTTSIFDNTVHSVTSDIQYQIEDSLLEQIARQLSTKMMPTFEHKCNNCGGTLEMRADEHIFKCPYCGSCYAVGTMQINDRW